MIRFGRLIYVFTYLVRSVGRVWQDLGYQVCVFTLPLPTPLEVERGCAKMTWCNGMRCWRRIRMIKRRAFGRDFALN
ncbi:hypothetical protein DEU56DRAFT_830244 [Suillus clintonianus]|uniref:uncharacterized protein n=1 Tax=Suillus clintonianus TaxID=1904413 RepID=UPI001B85FFCC|nr:uncharacterized protein DEU56DRAFT_830244 [Suillus clintonianus]KAG2123288.1 hypothetical protein DEU56DRAFT_830244 [Suillus clintonianus]